MIIGSSVLIGSFDSFGIEFTLDKDQDASTRRQWLFGKLRFWACGERLGNYHTGTSLRPAAVAMRRLLKHKGDRQDPGRWSLSKDDLFCLIFGALYVDTSPSAEELAREWKHHERFLAMPATDAFDDWMAFVVESPQRARFVWKNIRDPHADVREALLAPGQFDEVLEAAVQSIEGVAA